MLCEDNLLEKQNLQATDDEDVHILLTSSAQKVAAGTFVTELIFT